jgi:L-fuconolactonase
MKIDAHQHFWARREPFDHSWQDAPQLAPLRRDFLPEDLRPLIAETGIDRTVFVQTQHKLAENDFVLGLAAQREWIAGIVGWVDLASPECERQLLDYEDRPKFVGVRHVTHDEPDDDFIVREDVLRGLAVLQKHDVPFDLLFHVRHLKHAATLARKLPDLRMVIDHLAKPEIKAGKMEPWRALIREAAGFPNIFCKLSGMVTEADWERWKPSHLKPYVEVALEAFGPERCMFGSDWPVCILAAPYGDVYNALAACIADLSLSERDRVLGGTAAGFYGL